MKICSLIVIITLAMVACGCITAKPQIVSVYPNNTVVICNKSSYVLKVFRNNRPWEEERYEKYHLPMEIMPKQTVVLKHCGTEQSGEILLGLKAGQVWRAGCVISEKNLGMRNWKIEVGTNSPAKTIEIKNGDF